MATKRGTIPVDNIKEEFFVRQHLNQDHVRHLAQLYEAGTKLPPLIVTRENQIIDGRHRLAALRLLDKKAADVEWSDETNRAMNLVDALQANIGGSLPPSNADIVYAMEQMLEAGMQHSVITKNFSNIWPPAVIRRYYADAHAHLTKKRVTLAKEAVLNGKTIADAASEYGIKLDTLKSAIQGEKKRKKGGPEVKSALTAIFRSRGGSMGQTMRRVEEQFEDGEISWKMVQGILDHLDRLCKHTALSARDWRKRLEAKHQTAKVA